MVVVSDRILRIIGPAGKPATDATLRKLTLQEKEMGRHLSDLKRGGADDVGRQQEIRKLEADLKEIRKKMDLLKAQLEEMKAQEEKEAKARAASKSMV